MADPRASIISVTDFILQSAVVVIDEKVIELELKIRSFAKPGRVEVILRIP